MKDGYKDANKIFLHRNSESIVGPPYQSGSHSCSLYGRAVIVLSIGGERKGRKEKGEEKRGKKSEKANCLNILILILIFKKTSTQCVFSKLLFS